MPFKKNDPRINRDGRPKGSVSVVEAIKRKLKEETKGSTPKEKKTYLDELITQIMENAIEKGDVRMIKDIIDRVDGKPQSSVDLTTGGEKIERIDWSDLNIDLDDLNERLARKKDKVPSTE